MRRGIRTNVVARAVACIIDGSVARTTDGVHDVVATQGDSTAAAVDKA